LKKGYVTDFKMFTLPASRITLNS